MLYWSAWTAIIKYYRLGDLNKRNLFSYDSGGLEVQDQGTSIL